MEKVKVYGVLCYDLKEYTKDLRKRMTDDCSVLGIKVPKINLTKVVLYSDYLKLKKSLSKT